MEPSGRESGWPDRRKLIFALPPNTIGKIDKKPSPPKVPVIDWASIPQLVPDPADSFSVWVISDIQSTNEARARQVIRDATDDILEQNIPLSAVWCLGDALRGPDLELLNLATSAFLSQLSRCGAPICYVLGNHDMDYRNQTGNCHFPLWEGARAEPNWHVQERLEDFYLLRRFGKWLVVFLGDHADPAGKWFSTHGIVRGEESYPYMAEDYAELSRQIGGYDGPVILASHYAFPGGQKPSGLQAQLLPLPANVRALLHGHAHIGDLKWNRDDPWERVHAVEGQSFLQYNISALEPDRSPGSHSALLEFRPSGAVGMRIRCHETKEWVGEFEF